MTLSEVAPDAWEALLEDTGCSDVYFQSAYVEASCLLDGGRPRFLHLEADGGRVLLACSIRPVPETEGLHDATTPYGYGGPLVGGQAPPVQEFWWAYEAWCAANRVVTTFLRFHPLLENHRHAPRSAQLEPLAPTVAWPLDRGDDLFESMHRHHRRVVRKARREVEVEISETPGRLDDFVSLYGETMRRRGAEGFYFFPPAYWEALTARLSDALVRLDGLLGGEPVASLLCLSSPPWLHYHLGATLEPGRAVGASNLLMLEAARWARDAGYEQFHLGGGVGGRRDSLWEYKRRFSPENLREARVGKLVHDPGAYRSLTGGDEPDLTGFFPAYRAASLR